MPANLNIRANRYVLDEADTRVVVRELRAISEFAPAATTLVAQLERTDEQPTAQIAPDAQELRALNEALRPIATFSEATRRLREATQRALG